VIDQREAKRRVSSFSVGAAFDVLLKPLIHFRYYRLIRNIYYYYTGQSRPTEPLPRCALRITICPIRTNKLARTTTTIILAPITSTPDALPFSPITKQNQADAPLPDDGPPSHITKQKPLQPKPITLTGPR